MDLADVDTAYELGRRDRAVNRTNRAVLTYIMSNPASPGKQIANRYGPEQVVPRPDPDDKGHNGALQWQQRSMDELWTSLICSTSDETYGAVFQRSAQGRELQKQFETLALGIPEEIDLARTLLGDSLLRLKVEGAQELLGNHGNKAMIRPRTAFIDGFLRPLIKAPREMLTEIVYFSG